MVKKRCLTILYVVIASVLLGSLFYNNVAFASEGKVKYNLYFGDLHTHTIYSDAWEGTPTEAYTAAKAAGADFMATTDHHFMLTAKEWEKTLQEAEECTSHHFVAIAAYEFWMPGSGEINTYNAADMPLAKENPAGNGNNAGNHMARSEALPAFYDWLVQQSGASGQWNHPDYMTDNFYNYSYWTEARDQGMNILEIHNYGSWEWQSTHDYESSYIMALDKGWHVMPAANSDTHNPNWISGYEVRTVLLAPRLTRADLYDAMSARRGYATLDKNLRISYTLNGEIMGSNLLSPASTYIASIHIEDPDGTINDAITLVEIISDGGEVVASLPASDTTFDWTVTLTSETARYFYVRVSTASDVSGGEGVTAWTAPVWTGL